MDNPIDWFEWDRRAMPLAEVDVDTGPMEPREFMPWFQRLQTYAARYGALAGNWGLLSLYVHRDALRKWHVSATVRRSDNACN